jgi:protein SCO1/2/putative membrane protein
MRPFVAVLAIVALACIAGCESFPFGVPSEVLGEVGDFSLTDQNGRQVRREDLTGKLWIASFIFTRCAGPCAKVSQNMERLQGHLAGYPELRLVTFTVDPEYDTADVLRAYGERYKANPERWLFLTGPREEIYRLIRDDFKLGVSENEGAERKPGYEVAHSTKLVLVDERGRIRGYFDGSTTEQLPLLRRETLDIIWNNRLPAINAVLNGTCAMLLLLGYMLIRLGRVGLHQTCMLLALLVSVAFLISYLFYHFVVRQGEPTRFQGPDGVRYLYLGILLTHTVLAVVVAPAAVIVAVLGLRNKLQLHVRLARWAFPLWLYVSVTGVVIYFMLYQLYPSY